MTVTGLKDKSAIITGASQGIGAGIGRRLAKEGVNVVIADVLEEQGKRLAEELQKDDGKAMFVKCDVTNSQDVDNLVDKTVEVYGTVDILVNNAGISLLMPFRVFTEEHWNKTFNVNLKGMFFLCKKVLPIMVEKRNGKIVNISSIAGRFATAMQAPYCASKAGVIAFTKSLAYEYGKHNINVNGICPGIVRTPIWEKVLDDISAESGIDKDTIFKKYTDPIPLKRAQTPESIGDVVVFLCSEQAKDISAQTVSVTGGQDALFFDEDE